MVSREPLCRRTTCASEAHLADCWANGLQTCRGVRETHLAICVRRLPMLQVVTQPLRHSVALPSSTRVFVACPLTFTAVTFSWVARCLLHMSRTLAAGSQSFLLGSPDCGHQRLRTSKRPEGATKKNRRWLAGLLPPPDTIWEGYGQSAPGELFPKQRNIEAFLSPCLPAKLGTRSSCDAAFLWPRCRAGTPHPRGWSIWPAVSRSLETSLTTTCRA